MKSFRELARSLWVQRASGIAAAHYLRLVWSSSRVIIEPADVYERLPQNWPVILGLWHGQHFLAPFLKPRGLQATSIAARSITAPPFASTRLKKGTGPLGLEGSSPLFEPSA